MVRPFMSPVWQETDLGELHYNINDAQLYPRKIIMPGCQNSSMSATIRQNSEFVDMVHSLLNSSKFSSWSTS